MTPPEHVTPTSDLVYSDNCAGSLAVFFFESDEPAITWPGQPPPERLGPTKILTRRTPLYPDLEVMSGLARAFVRSHISSGREVRILNKAGECVFHSKDRGLLHPGGPGLTGERFEVFWSSLP